MINNTINNRTMQKSNLALVLRTIFDCEGISRRGVAAQTGLTPSTVTNIVGRLLREELVTESDDDPEGNAPVGRRPIRLSIRASRYAVIGVELSADRITGVITDFTGKPLAQRDVENSGSNPPQVAVEKIKALVNDLLKQANISRETVLGVGVMSSGPYDRETGVMLNPPNFDHWDAVPIRDMVESALELPVCFDRDSVGCALAATASSEETVFAMMINTIGIGGALLINGDVFYGLDNCAAEVGCMNVIENGPLCRCGDYGCLEAVASADALLRYIAERVKAGEENPFADGSDTPDATALAEAYRAGKRLAVEAANRGAKYIGIALGNVIKIISPDVIALGGRFLVDFPEYYDLIVQAACQRRQAQPRFIPFEYGAIQCALGGVQQVLQKLLKTMEE